MSMSKSITKTRNELRIERRLSERERGSARRAMRSERRQMKAIELNSGKRR